ncbi:hypothetical protein HW561_01290 [Rhodobacteraceae bacterium B1Z28]|uniref:DUF6455 domain-containing protein n=1 Tax=Ruegeria haliotis TaxID=2747601 RepID=A0ABX2PK68_9RHOB|nr:DUF6455 family protein [Ruegeria haliotis]NVO54423.1 hypothetical protein [Ruegeria haliotis]
MPNQETLRLHAGLVDDMAKMLDVDLEEAAIGGDVSFDQISDAVLRCAACPNPEHCRNILKQARSLHQTPEYCRNQELLHKLIP